MALFLDIEALSARQTDMALGFIYKAIHGHDGDDAIWDAHPSPMIRRLVELFTTRGLDRLAKVRTELVAWLEGERHQPTLPAPQPPGMMQRWTAAEMELARLYLESLPPAEWTVDDHMMVIDYIAQRYLPPQELKTEAEWLAVRSALMGKVQAGMGELPAAEADVVLARLPLTAAASNTAGTMRTVVDLAVARAAEHVTSVGEDVRHTMRALVARRIERTMAGQTGVPALQTELVDAFADLNRDWRRIAITEATEALGQGLVASVRPGMRMKRVEQYRNACTWCQKIHGTVLKVVEPRDVDKDGATEIWPGKNNIGRSSAPRKRVGGQLVEREPDEMWWVSAGAQHPNCRGRWVMLPDEALGDDEEFGAWLSATLAKPPRSEDGSR